jgi:hypothetical protein
MRQAQAIKVCNDFEIVFTSSLQISTAPAGVFEK